MECLELSLIDQERVPDNSDSPEYRNILMKWRIKFVNSLVITDQVWATLFETLAGAMIGNAFEAITESRDWWRFWD